jgi:hypothetical protein
VARLNMRQLVEGNLVLAALERLASRLDGLAPARRRAVTADWIQRTSSRPRGKVCRRLRHGTSHGSFHGAFLRT